MNVHFRARTCDFTTFDRSIFQIIQKYYIIGLLEFKG